VGPDKLRLHRILAQALAGGGLAPRDLAALLAISDGEDRQRVFRAARELRRRHFGPGVFLYGFIYLSTHCRNDCRFCHYRRSNTAQERYRLSPAATLEAAGRLARSGVHLIDLTMGEDPFFHDRGAAGFAPLVRLVSAVKAATRLPVMISPGRVAEGRLAQLAAAGADWLACYQETYNRTLFAGLRPEQDFDARRAVKVRARQAGLLVEEGILVAVGESRGDVAEAVEAMGHLEADQVRVMTFVPQEGTPMAGGGAPSRERELLTLAALRLALPDRLIPASLDVDGLEGLADRLNAGANVVTSLVPPGLGLAGVARTSLDIEEARRTPEAVRPVLASLGLEAASPGDYALWMENRRGMRIPAANRRVRP
jgi:methylornithine synthase